MRQEIIKALLTRIFHQYIKGKADDFKSMKMNGVVVSNWLEEATSIIKSRTGDCKIMNTD